MKKVLSVLVVLAIATFVGCGGTQIKYSTINGSQYDAIQFERTKAFGHDYAGIALVPKPQPPVQVTTTVPAPAPTYAPAPSEERCSIAKVRDIQRRLELNYKKIYGDRDKKLKGCDDFCVNNLENWTERGDLFYEAFRCSCEKEDYFEAIKSYKRASKNYLYGKDIKKNKARADQSISRAYQNWARIQQEAGKCKETVAVVTQPAPAPAPQAIFVSQAPLQPFFYAGGNASTGNWAVPAGLLGAGIAANGALQRPSDTNINASARGGRGGAGGASSSSSSSASSSSAAAAAAAE